MVRAVIPSRGNNSTVRRPQALIFVGEAVALALAVELEATMVEFVPFTNNGVVMPSTVMELVAVGSAAPAAPDWEATNLSRHSLVVVPFAQQRVWLRSPG